MSTGPCRVPTPRQGSPRPSTRAALLTVAWLGLLAGGALAQGQAQDEPERDANGDIVFGHALDNQPIAFAWRPDQAITPAVEQFHTTAENAYSDDPAAIEAGEKLYARLCQACHLADGTGRIGPSLVGNNPAQAPAPAPLRDHLRRRCRRHAGLRPAPRPGPDPAGHGVSRGVARGGGLTFGRGPAEPACSSPADERRP
jgi:mono/diheme cytochrome c family protein